MAFRHSNETNQPIVAETGLVDVIDVPIKDTWAAMERLVEQGKIRSIGVSNFTREKIEELFKTYVEFSEWTQFTQLTLFSAKIRPTVNQIEAHPYLQQRDLLQWSKDNVSLPNTSLPCKEHSRMFFILTLCPLF